MAVNLTTRFLFWQYARVTAPDSADSLLVDRLIDQVSQAVAQWCDRTFALTEYREWYDGSGAPFLALPNWPLTRIYGASQTTRSGGTIKFSGGKWASASITDGSLYLSSINTSGTVSHASAIALADSNLTELAALVAAKTGWTMTVDSAAATEPAILLRPIDGEWALSPDSADLDLADESEPVQLAAGTNRMITRPGGLSWYAGQRNVFVWYSAGYTLPIDAAGHSSLGTAGNVPADLTLCVNEILKDVWSLVSTSDVGPYESEKIGDYSYKSPSDVSAAIKRGIEIRAATLQSHRALGFAQPSHIGGM